MPGIINRPSTAGHQADLNRRDRAFTVQAELCLTAEDGRSDRLFRTPWRMRQPGSRISAMREEADVSTADR